MKFLENFYENLVSEWCDMDEQSKRVYWLFLITAIIVSCYFALTTHPTMMIGLYLTVFIVCLMLTVEDSKFNHILKGIPELAPDWNWKSRHNRD